MVRFDDGATATVVGGWSEAPVPQRPGRRHGAGWTATPRRRACTGRGAPARIDDYDGARRRARRARCAGSASAAPSPRRSSSAGGLWGAVIVSSVEPEPFPAGRRAADRRLRRARRAGARQRAARARSWPPRAPASSQAGDAERRRLERNLHDGAQQRLVSLALMLRLAARRHPDDAGRSSAAGEELTHALEELRELARGIHPAVLTERGLEPAVEALADARAAAGRARRRARTSGCPGPVEAAAYYVVAEALTNVAKYARASRGRASASARANGARAASRCATTASAAPHAERRLRPARARGPRRGARRAARRRQPDGRGDDAARRDPRAAADLTAAELLRSVTARARRPRTTRRLRGAAGRARARRGRASSAWDGGTLSVPVPGVGRAACRDRRAGRRAAGRGRERRRADRAVRVAAGEHGSARRRAMLDVAFDSVVTMDDRGRRARRSTARRSGCSATRRRRWSGARSRTLIIPPSLREAHRHGIVRYLRDGARAGRRAAGGADRDARRRHRVPGRAGRDPARRARRAGLLRLPARPDRAQRRRGDAAPAGRRAGGAAAGGDGGRGARTTRRGCSRSSARRSGGCSRPRPRTCSASTPTARGGTIVGGWALRPEHVLPVGTRMPLDGDTAATRVWRTGRAARMDSYEGAEGELAATMRGYGVQAVVAAPVFLGGALWGAVIVSSMEPRAVPGGRRAADLLLRRAGRAGAGQRAGAGGAGRVARPDRAAGDAERRRAPRTAPLDFVPIVTVARRLSARAPRSSLWREGEEHRRRRRGGAALARRSQRACASWGSTQS